MKDDDDIKSSGLHLNLGTITTLGLDHTFELDIIEVQVDYPGASPEEVEKGILQPVEEAVRSVQGVKEMSSRAGEGGGCLRLTSFYLRQFRGGWLTEQLRLMRLATCSEKAQCLHLNKVVSSHYNVKTWTIACTALLNCDVAQWSTRH